MAVNLRKFVNPRFLRTVDPELLSRLLERHRHRLIGLDVDLAPPVAVAWEELRHWVREQSLSITRHRHGRPLL